MKPIELYLVRHGETELNKLNKIQGWVDSPLTEAGLEIAHLCGLGLKDIEFDVAYSSDLMRAVKTAEIIVELNHQREIPYYAESNLREISFGHFGGGDKNFYRTASSKVLFGKEDLPLLAEQMKTKELTLKDLIDAGHSLDTSGEAESYEDFESRIVEATERIFKRAAAENHEKILVVSHGLAIYALINFLSKDSIDTISQVKNASVSLVTFEQHSMHVEEAPTMKYVRAGKRLQENKSYQVQDES